MYKNSILFRAIQLAIFTTSATAFAEEEQTKGKEQQTGLERITVTSNKKVQSIQQIPTSIQAYSGEHLTKNNISNLLDMSESLPNVHITESSSSKRIVVRGIGSGTNSGFEQSVAMYKDGIYLGRGHQAKFPFLDMQRIELVKGPQAIMFGKNATAGALSMITNSPTDEFEGEVSATIGSNKQREFSAVLNLPVTDDFALRLAAFNNSEDGYIYNQARDQDEVDTSSSGFRLSALWQPSASSEFNFNIEQGQFDSNGSRYQYIIDEESRGLQIAADPTNPANVGYRTLLLADDSGLDYTSSISGAFHPGGLDEGSDTDLLNSSLQYVYSGNDYEFTSVTTYSEYDWDSVFDADYSEVSLIKQTYIENYEQFTQEFRVSGALAENLDYVTGVYFLHSEIEHPNDVLLGASVLIPDLPGVSIGTTAQFEQEQTSYSAFAALNWTLSDQWKLNLGLRYQSEDKEVTSEQGVYTLFSEQTPAPIQAYANSIAPVLATSLSGAGQHKFSAERSENHLLPSVSLEFHGFEDTLVFVSAGKGAKAGGFDGSGLNASMGSAPDPDSGFEFEDEEATNLEFGFKSELIDQVLELNATAFYTNYENLQVSEFNGKAFVVNNAAEAKVKGVELDARWYINDNFDLTSSFALLDFEYDKFTGASPTVYQAELLGMATQDLSGETGAFAPKYSGNVNLNYHLDMAGGYLLDTTLSVQFTDDFYLEQDLDPIAHQDAYQKLNLRIELTSPEGDFSIALLGKNLTDKTTFSQANDVPVLSYAHRFLVEAPRSVHLQMNYRF
ncbi:TonB-dependent receptor [Psychrosphaera aestuarii]|uniref:TonB-dependent receptor n=1 Tax=Psychrosphaera aestuarii TaxID=1266052 RepID=UPI001B320432|nr:TonB-dependent receptor [Psychrosphaera aestuarii]